VFCLKFIGAYARGSIVSRLFLRHFIVSPLMYQTILLNSFKPCEDYIPADWMVHS